MTISESTKSKLNPLNLFRNQINPEFIEFVHQNIAEVKNLFVTITESIEGSEFQNTFTPKIDSILQEIKNIKSNFDLYGKKFKFYTEETEKSLRKFGFLLKELNKSLKFNQEAFESEKKEIYLLNIVNNWRHFHSDVKDLFYDIENNEYPYTIHTIFSLAFVLVPFLNIFSLVGGIYLLMKKDWRALIFGAITLILYFIQAINILNLAIIG
ncbi:MAG: hypothetical protein R6U96_06355 [Promethearchaeia archaeon]